MGQKLFQVDAFTDKSFAGNPAGVCILPKAVTDEWMLKIASEINCAETAFLLRQDGGCQVRSFTPRTEVTLFGHATLASAHILWQEGFVQPNEEARFTMKSGTLVAKRIGKWVEMDFSSKQAKTAEAPPNLTKALGVTAKYVGKNEFDYLIEVDSEETLRAIRPNYLSLETVPMRGVIVTAPSSTAAYDFVSRFFAPAVGVNEDSVTGSAHCCLGPYWAEKLKKKEMMGYQASPRGGVVGMRCEGEKVILLGQAITVMRSELVITTI
jgi:PhzF family phenazine biosynthesis protein